MKLRLPWARRAHGHDSHLHVTCGRCGHQLLYGYVGNRRVTLRTRHMESGDNYGESCAPNFDLVEIAGDYTPRYYLEGEQVEPVDVPPSLAERIDEWVERTKEYEQRDRARQEAGDSNG